MLRKVSSEFNVYTLLINMCKVEVGLLWRHEREMSKIGFACTDGIKLLQQQDWGCKDTNIAFKVIDPSAFLLCGTDYQMPAVGKIHDCTIEIHQKSQLYLGW